ncbi:MAG: type II toxin-antitoxin system PemK/MazF family toxin [Sandaracinaceae bacterium]|nr:type II toxin-antitoxin system PemK/MazF family toxin [Sandaracinaceae bacterium]
MTTLRRGEIRWHTFKPPDKRRPVLLLTRAETIDVLDPIMVAVITTTVRGIPTEVRLSVEEGMPAPSAIKLDHVTLVRRSDVGRLITTLDEERWPEVEQALLVACGFRRPPSR